VSVTFDSLKPTCLLFLIGLPRRALTKVCSECVREHLPCSILCISSAFKRLKNSSEGAATPGRASARKRKEPERLEVETFAPKEIEIKEVNVLWVLMVSLICICFYRGRERN